MKSYAANEKQSRGRKYDEPRPAYRGEYQRDRDRIIHSTAFRRLVYKTCLLYTSDAADEFCHV